MEVAQGRFNNKEGEGDLTRLESRMSFLQVRASMSIKEKLRQVRGAICVNRREIAHTRLEAIAGADNPYSLHHHHLRERPSRLEGQCTSHVVLPLRCCPDHIRIALKKFR
jgi:hypothetical protein